MDPSRSLPQGLTRHHPARRVLAGWLALCLAMQPLAVGAASEVLPNLGDASSDDLSPQNERKLGEEIMRQAREAGDVMDDDETTEYLNQFGVNLIAHAPPNVQNIEFFPVRDAQINAFALPGGYIGVNSGLIISTQSESELASVMAHEMGHVIQRHIARQIGREKQTSMVALAAMVLGMLAMARSSNGDAGQAGMALGSGYAISDQLAFSRDAEREADRVGFQILKESGFDSAGMTTFFSRLQQATTVYENGAPSFLRDHPMTTERIADIQNRIRETPYKQRPDSPDFQLIRARLRVVQGNSAQGVVDARAAFEDQLKTGSYASEAAVRYGLALALMRQNDIPGAQREFAKVRKLMPKPDPVLENFAVQLRMAAKDNAGAVTLAEAARSQFPQSRMLALSYAGALQGAGRDDDAIVFLRDQISLYRQEPKLYEALAKSYAAKGQDMLAHKTMAENYVLRGSVHGAIEQLEIARKSGNGDFYENSQIDARLRELQAQWLDIQKAQKERRSLAATNRLEQMQDDRMSLRTGTRNNLPAGTETAKP